MAATKEERDKAAADRAWRKATDEHAVQLVRFAITAASLVNGSIRDVPDQGGHVVEIRGPDGEWRRYFVRLTEVRA